ncbi:Ger(x)C family spore germination protein [Paenibacillus sp. EC2-1]|uniref:Ger(x)C family spore germination protein n=1 Tax=Paenibacillus sp. EC2-1 TaxID=3388665 RepID=UPI003BEED1C6
MKHFKRYLVMLMCSSMMILGGCEFRDIDLRLFVVAIGVDVIEDNSDLLRFSFKMSLPTGDPKTGEVNLLVVTEDATNIATAIRQAKSKVDKELDFGHCKGVMYGEAYARRDIRKVQDWTIRRRDIQLLMYPTVAIPTAEAVLKVQPKTERIAGNSLFLALSEDGSDSPYITKMYSFDLARRMNEKGKDPIMPVIEVVNESLLDIKKVALMDKQKVLEILSPEETKLFNLLFRKDLRTNFGMEQDGNHYEANITNSRAKFNIKSGGLGQEEIAYTIRLMGNLEEKDEVGKLTHQDIVNIEQGFSKDIATDVTNLLEKIQKTGVDPLGFGLRYFGTHWNNETEVEEWREMYPRIKFGVKVHTAIKSTGYNR